MNSKLQTFVLLIIAGLLSLSTFTPKATAPAQYGAGAGTSIYFTATGTVNTSVACANGTSTLFLAGSSGRTYAAWTVESSTAATFFFNSTSTGLTQGNGLYIVGSGGSYELKAENLYVGPIYCMGNGATTTVGLIYNQ